MLKYMLFLGIFTSAASCHKTTTGGDTIVRTGTLQKQGVTTYQYGTHVLQITAADKLVLKSSTLNLDGYVGMHVKVTAVNTHYTVENGPELYDVTAIVQE